MAAKHFVGTGRAVNVRSFTLPMFLFIFLAGGAALVALLSDTSTSARGASLALNPVAACPVTEPAWLVWPEDSAIPQEPQPGYFIVNQDRSIWASAWWWEADGQYPVRAGKDGNKVGWFRPAGAPLEITGQRLDADAPPLQPEIPCCYPTRFQATGLYFPTAGCWQVIAKAGDSILEFVVRVEP